MNLNIFTWNIYEAILRNTNLGEVGELVFADMHKLGKGTEDLGYQDTRIQPQNSGAAVITNVSQVSCLRGDCQELSSQGVLQYAECGHG